MARTKNSHQRDLLFEILCSTKTHPTADWLYTEAKKTIPNISLGTVYRNLALLSSQGMIMKLDVGDGCDHYDGDVSRHYHFVCKGCGCVSDLDIPYCDELDAHAADCSDKKIDLHHITFFGECGNCSNN